MRLLSHIICSVLRPPLSWGVLFLFCLLLSACGSLSATALSVQGSDALQLSQRADRKAPIALHNRTVSGNVYIFAASPKTTRTVQFHLNGKLIRQSSTAPFDLLGGTVARAKPLDTRTLNDGRQTLRATLTDANGRRSVLERTFTVLNNASSPRSQRWQPQPGLTWQWQLQGRLDTSLAVDVYDIDLFDTPASTIAGLQARGIKVICYFSAGSFESWREDADAFPTSVKGKKMDGWDELWLDVRNPALKPIMRARLELAAEKGCDAVEPDNVDAYANASGFPLRSSDQLAYNRFLADEAHRLGLAIGLKNDLDQVVALEPYFDFAVNEQCFEYRECDKLGPFIRANKAVFGAEYERATRAFCPVTEALGLSTIKKRYDLGAYRDACP